MSATGDVTFNIGADTSQFESAVKGAEQSLQELGGAGAAGGEAAAKGLQKAEKATKEAKKATDDAAKSAKEAKSSLDQMGDSAGKVGAASGKMRGALDLLSPAAAETAGLVNDLGDAGEVLSQTLGKMGPAGRVAALAFTGLAVIVPVVGEALMDQTVASEELQAQYAALERATVAAEAAQRNYDAALKGAQAEMDVILGLKSREQVATEKAIDTMRAQTQATLDANQAVIVSEAVTRDKIHADIEAGRNTTERTILEQRFKVAMEESVAAEERAVEANRRARADLEKYIAVKQGELDVAEKEKQDREKADRARAYQSKLEGQRREQEAKLAEQKRKQEADAAKDAQARADADKLAGKLLDERLEKEELAARQYEEQAKLLRAELAIRRERGMEAASIEDAIVQAETRAVEERAALVTRLEQERQDAAEAEKERIKQLSELNKKQAEEAEAAAEAEKERRMELASASLEIATSLSDSLLSLADREAEQRGNTLAKLQEKLEEGEDTLTKAQKKQLRERIQEERAAAREVFRTQQGLQIATATMNAAQAVLNALANVPAPLNIAAAAAAGIAGAVQVGLIATQKPKFHAGGMVYPDEGNATLLGGEAVLNRRATETLGADAVDALNAGRQVASPAPTLRIGRLEAREILRTDMLGGGYLVGNLSRYVAPSSSRTVFA